MTSSIPNFLESALENDNEFKSTMQSALINLYNSTDEVYCTNKKKTLRAKLFQNKEKKQYYLVVDNGVSLTVYREPIYSWKSTPFDYTVKELINEEEVHASHIITLEKNVDFKKQSKGKKKDKVSSLDEMLNDITVINSSSKTQEEKDKLVNEISKKFSQYIRNMNFEEKTFKSNMHDGHIKALLSYLKDNNMMTKEYDDTFWVNKSEKSCRYVEEYMDQLKITFNFLFDMCDKHKYTSKKKFFFNDSDNHMWAEGKGIVVTSQGLGFYITMKGEEITVYCYDKENENFKKHNSLKPLIKDIESNENNFVDNIAFKIVNDKVVYVSNAAWYCLSSDLSFTKEALIEEGKGEPSYPIDITEYDYQLKYYQSSYGISEFDFLAKAFMSGGGFEYNKKKGTFDCSGVEYDSSLKIFTTPKEPTKITSFDYCYPKKGITQLNEKWLKGLEYMVSVLKRDMPLPVASETSDKKADVEKAIVYWQAQLKKIKPVQETQKLKM